MAHWYDEFVPTGLESTQHLLIGTAFVLVSYWMCNWEAAAAVLGLGGFLLGQQSAMRRKSIGLLGLAFLHYRFFTHPMPPPPWTFTLCAIWGMLQVFWFLRGWFHVPMRLPVMLHERNHLERLGLMFTSLMTTWVWWMVTLSVLVCVAVQGQPVVVARDSLSLHETMSSLVQSLTEARAYQHGVQVVVREDNVSLASAVNLYLGMGQTAATWCRVRVMRCRVGDVEFPHADADADADIYNAHTYYQLVDSLAAQTSRGSRKPLSCPVAEYCRWNTPEPHTNPSSPSPSPPLPLLSFLWTTEARLADHLTNILNLDSALDHALTIGSVHVSKIHALLQPTPHPLGLPISTVHRKIVAFYTTTELLSANGRHPPKYLYRLAHLTQHLYRLYRHFVPSLTVEETLWDTAQKLSLDFENTFEPWLSSIEEFGATDGTLHMLEHWAGSLKREYLSQPRWKREWDMLETLQSKLRTSVYTAAKAELGDIVQSKILQRMDDIQATVKEQVLEATKILDLLDWQHSEERKRLGEDIEHFLTLGRG
ncbi:hypothetical protein AC578_1479 [Pseudocercospora eumusae]|uniref:Uncharacterized protein n=1 Tax=Pseudocercospora eumusae TaxID=321146 RepID=A0A139H5K0_9PEZI|nr:hypothetical protein AC578_1479 [Pseudocercospora eumusae]